MSGEQKIKIVKSSFLLKSLYAKSMLKMPYSLFFTEETAYSRSANSIILIITSSQIYLPNHFKRNLRFSVFRQQSVDFLLYIGYLCIAIAREIGGRFNCSGDCTETFDKSFDLIKEMLLFTMLSLS